MSIFSIINLFVIASAATACTYWLFYYFSPFIWSFNATLPLNEYVPWVRDHFSGHPGIQVYALYVFLFLNFVFSYFLNAVFLNIKRQSLKKIFVAISLVVSFVFFSSIKFHLPVADPASSLPGFMFVGAVFLLNLFIALNHKARWIPVFVFIFLLGLCLVTATELSRIDYGYIMSPAWSFLHGAGLNKTLSQYDYLLPVLAAGWIKIFPLETIPLLGRLSYFALFFGAYLLARNFFNNKQLACYLLISMVTIKIYGNLVPPDGILQVSPWRLDWWIVLLALAYWKTARHWIVAAVLGFLIIFHHSFGCLYAVSYISFILMLIALETAAGKEALADILKRHFFLYFRNVIILLTAFLLYEIFLRPALNMSVFYQKTGLDFLRIARESFYWCMPVIFASVFLLLGKNRLLLSPRYVETSMFLLSLAMGNSVYFFGRSHENNIINIAAVLLMVFFLLLDLVDFDLIQSPSLQSTRWVVPLAACMVILMVSYAYAGRAIKLVYIQLANLKNHAFISNSFSDFESLDFSQLKTLTHSSPEVIFVSQQDFFFYYYGKYPLPQNYRSSTCSWFILKDYLDYLNERLDKGYYIVVNPQEISGDRDVINGLKARYFSNTPDLLVFSNKPLRGFDKSLWDR